MGKLDLPYEKIIRSAFQCNGGTKHGAKADIHTSLVTYHRLYLEIIEKRQISGDDNDPNDSEDLDEYQRKMVLVKTYIISAIDQIIKYKQHTHFDKCLEINEIRDSLQNNIKFDVIENSIIEITIIMKNMGYRDYTGLLGSTQEVE
ncbi:MAG TPA: hypothetical protein PLL66_06740 [Bacteroidales bacterium]|mgnify:CR=1 FL=1|nr:hypothetical protein [Bacteroidales bacterium]